MTLAITDFRGPYAFLSNFHPSRICFMHCMNGVSVGPIPYATAEHAFQAAKATNLEDHMLVATAVSPGQAKKLGRNIVRRKDWDQVKQAVMASVLTEKFKHPELRRQLLATGTAELVEGNTWGDVFWGVCNGVGENHLGRLLMAERDRIRAEQTA